MKYADWKTLATMCIILGTFFTIGGIFGYFYFDSFRFTGYPFRVYTLLSLVVGFVYLVVGVSFFRRTKKKENVRLK